MRGLMMDFPLTVGAILRHAEQVAARREIVTRLPDRTLHRYCYADFARRARQLAAALHDLGIGRADRVATLAWNHSQHLETYFAVPLMGAVLHTLNLRLSPDELAFIANDAADRVVIVDESLLPLWDQVRPQLRHPPQTIVVGAGAPPPGALAYEALVESAKPMEECGDEDEYAAAAMCYTTGTTGRPKGVLFSHRSLVLHTLGVSLGSVAAIAERDAILPVVPMFHANAWGLPYAAALAGAKLVMPGRHLDPPSVVDLIERERVTVTAGVPTIWMGVLQLLDANPRAHDLSSVRLILIGGAAIPRAVIEAFQTRYNLSIVHAWGMTETSPVGTVCHLPPDLEGAGERAFAYRAKQGRPAPLVEIRARNDEGLVPHDASTMGELEVRGPWVASAYYGRTDCADRFTDDGWFRTGDIVTIDDRSTISIQDRTKDLIKSGGEWISSVALECALMGHPCVAEAAVIPIADARWSERPLAAVVLKPGAAATANDLRAFLEPQFPRWWLPDAFEFIDAIPRTSAGKFMKSALRERFADYRTGAGAGHPGRTT